MTEDFGYLSDKYLTDGDVLSSISIKELLGVIDIKNWNSNTVSGISKSETAINSISAISGDFKLIAVNEKVFNEKTWLLCKLEEVVSFENVESITMFHQIFNVESESFEPVSTVETLDTLTDICYNINADGAYIIQNALGFISV